jgi:ADP-heptose:LPS heptosyltransferase
VSFGLGLQADERRRVGDLLAGVADPMAAFFVGASWRTKLWHAEPAAEVVDRLAERGIAPVLVGGPGDVAVAEEIVAACETEPVNLVGRTSLRDVIGIFERATVAFGPDSGPMHIAAAVGVPVVSLFGATSPQRSAPYGFEHLVIEGEARCRPCYSRRCPIDRECMRAITAEAVLKTIARAVGESGR